MSPETGVSVHDYIHVFRMSVGANFGAFGNSSYPEVPLSLAKEESNVMSLFSALNATITTPIPPRERLQATSPITTYAMPITRDNAIQNV